MKKGSWFMEHLGVIILISALVIISLIMMGSIKDALFALWDKIAGLFSGG